MSPFGIYSFLRVREDWKAIQKASSVKKILRKLGE